MFEYTLNMTTLNVNMVLNKPTFKHMQGLIPD